MTTKQWIIISIVVVIIILIGYAIKVTLDKKAEEDKKLLYQSQLQNFNAPVKSQVPFISQVFGTFLSLYGLGI